MRDVAAEKLASLDDASSMFSPGAALVFLEHQTTEESPASFGVVTIPSPGPFTGATADSTASSATTPRARPEDA
jgi:hypothetical protein